MIGQCKRTCWGICPLAVKLREARISKTTSGDHQPIAHWNSAIEATPRCGYTAIFIGMVDPLRQFFGTTASLQSWGIALSEWVDSQPEPWATGLRFLPLGGSFFLGAILVWLWKRQPRPAPEKDAAPKLSPPQTEPGAATGEKIDFEKNARATSRHLESKDQGRKRRRADPSAAEGPDLVAAETLPSTVVPGEHDGVEPPEGLQEFAAGSEKLALAAARFRQAARQSGEEPAATDDDGQREAPVDWGEMLLFRSADPSIWNQSVDGGEDHRAVPLASVPGNAAFLRLRRVDTGEGIVIPIVAQALAREGDVADSGFNGSAEKFYGARHLGIFHENLPQEVEIRFAYGGWGFGHRAGDGSSQALGWAGEEIDADTVIEITVFPSLPELAPGDRLLKSL